jgi:hypothetical protein
MSLTVTSTNSKIIRKKPAPIKRASSMGVMRPPKGILSSKIKIRPPSKPGIGKNKLKIASDKLMVIKSVISAQMPDFWASPEAFAIPTKPETSCTCWPAKSRPKVLTICDTS